MASLGQELKRERELRGISLQEIAASTRISLKFLQALEEDRLDVIPGKFFIRAILRSYAKSIGLDENQVLNRYQEFQGSFDYQAEIEVPKKSGPQLIRRRRNLLLLLASIFVILALGLVSILVLAPGKTPEAPLRSELKPSPGPASSPPVEAPKPEEKIYDGLNLDISFLEDTWLQVSADGAVIWDGIKKEGESIQIRGARELGLNLGNAGGLAFTINGKKGKPFGPRGAVRKDIKITLGNYSEFLLPEEESQG
jgi:transcriptional regulator with XRE-family HTH domain